MIFTFFSLILTHATSYSQSCDLTKLAHPPQIVLVGEGHAEMASGQEDPAILAALNQSVQMRAKIFALARADKFSLYSEVYVTPDGERTAPFFPPLKAMYDAGNRVHGIESSALMAVGPLYKSLNMVYRSGLNGTAFSEVLENSLRFDAQMNAWDEVLKTSDVDPALRTIKEKIYATVSDLKLLRGRPKVLENAHLRRIDGETKDYFNQIVISRFSDDEIQVLIEKFQDVLIKQVNARYNSHLKPLTKDDQKHGRVDDMVEEVRRFRDHAFVTELTPALCSESAAKSKLVVINVGARHVKGVKEELTKLSHGRLSIKPYFTIQPKGLESLQADLQTEAFKGQPGISLENRIPEILISK